MTKRTNPLLEQEARKAQQAALVKQAQEIEQSKKIKLTLSLTETDIAAIKKLAIDKKTTVSNIIHEWISANT